VRIERFRLCGARRPRMSFTQQCVRRHQAIDRMPIRLIVRQERALGSCEFCTGLIQTDCLEIEFGVRLQGLTSGSFSGHG
jgi:hypothetical protein